MSEKTEMVCGGCGRPFIFGEVLAECTVICGRCDFVMRLTPEEEKPSSELAEAIVASLASAPAVNAEGKTVCNCGDCRIARN